MAACRPCSQLIGTWQRMDKNGDIICKESSSSSSTVIPNWARVLLDYNVEEKKKNVVWPWHPLVDNIVDKL